MASMAGHLSFEEVRRYLKGRGLDRDDASSGVGNFTLGDLRRKFESDDLEMEKLKKAMVSRREAEKADELRRLKVQQQKLRARKTQEESEIRDIMEKLEKRKEAELRLRLERERIKRELQSVDQSRLSTLGAEKRRELDALAKEKEALASREQEVAAEVQRLEERILAQEQAFREQQHSRQMWKNGEESQSRTDAKQQELLNLARLRGQRAATLIAQREELEQRREDVVRRLHGGRNRGDGGTAVAEAENASKKDEINKLVDQVRRNIGSNTEQLARAKRAMEQDAAAEVEQRATDDTEITALRPDGVNTQLPFAVEAENFLDEWLQQSNEGVDPIREGIVPPTSGPAQGVLGHAMDELDKIVQERSALNGQSKSVKRDGPNQPVQASNQHDGDGVKKTAPSAENQHGRPIVDPNGRNDARPGSKSGLSSDQFPSTSDPLSPAEENIHRRVGFEHLNNSSSLHPQRGVAPHSTAYQHRQNGHIENLSNQPMIGGGQPHGATQTAADEAMLREVASMKAEYIQAGVNDPAMWAQISALETEASARLRDSNSGDNAGLAAQRQAMPHFRGARANQAMPHHHSQPPPPSGMYCGGVAPYYSGMAAYGAGIMGGADGMVAAQERENQRLQQELEILSANQERDRMEAQRREFTKALERVSMRLTTGVGGNSGGGGGTTTTGHPATDQAAAMASYAEHQAAALRAIEALPKDSELYQLQMQHLLSMTQMKFEMDQLKQKQELSTMQEKLRKKDAEEQKKADHELWMAEQRRELIAARMRKTIAKENEQSHWGGGQSPYIPSEGFVLYVDYVTNVPIRFDKLQIVYCFYDGNTPKTRAKSLPICECEATDAPATSQCIVAARRQFQKVAPLASLRLLVEVQHVMPNAVPGMASRTVSIGWSVLELFYHTSRTAIELQEGPIKLALQRPPVNTATFETINIRPPPSNQQHITVHLRIVKAADTEAAAHFGVDPAVTHHLYKWPRGKGGKLKRGGQPSRRQLESRESRHSRHSSRSVERNKTRGAKKRLTPRLETPISSVASDDGNEEEPENESVEENAGTIGKAHDSAEKSPPKIGIWVKKALFSALDRPEEPLQARVTIFDTQEAAEVGDPISSDFTWSTKCAPLPAELKDEPQSNDASVKVEWNERNTFKNALLSSDGFDDQSVALIEIFEVDGGTEGGEVDDERLNVLFGWAIVPLFTDADGIEKGVKEGEVTVNLYEPSDRDGKGGKPTPCSSSSAQIEGANLTL